MRIQWICWAALALPSVAVAQAEAASAPVRVAATTTDLAALARAIGGADVDATALAAGVEDPHFLVARPSAIRTLHGADLLLDVGRELEVGWLPLLSTNARNKAVLDGGSGRLTAGDVVRRLGVPTQPTDRGDGDVHAAGNPHFLTDPLCGLQVAAAIAGRLTALRPERAAEFAAGLQRLRRAVAEALVGKVVAERYAYDAEKLCLLFGAGRLEALLRQQGDLDALGGWARQLQPWRGAAVVADHDLWPYFAERFGLRVIAFLEPKPGVAPTTAHLQQVVETMRAQHVGVILSAPWFAEQHAEAVARATGARIAAMAPQVGARPLTDDYVRSIDHNVQAVVAALAEAAK